MASEQQRLAELRRYEVLDTPPEAEYDRITALAAHLLEAPAATITFIDDTRQWFKSRYGVVVEQTPRATAFGARTIESDGPFVVSDASRDDRFRDNPFVAGSLGIRAYAGVPLITPRGYRIGTIAVMDSRPRQFTATHLETLRALGALVVTELERRGAAGTRLFRETDLRLAALMEQLPAIVWSVDNELRITSAMGAGLRELGLEPHELAGTLLADHVGNSNAADASMGAHRAALLGDRVSFELVWKGRHLRSHVRPLRDAEGNVVGALGLSLDVSEQRTTEERYRLIARATNDVIWDWDVATGTVFRNEAMEKFFGYRADQIAPTVTWWQDRIYAADRERVLGEIHRILNTPGTDSWSLDFRFHRGDGGVAEVLDRGFIVRDEAGKPVRIVGAMTDVSARNRLQARLRHSDRLASVGTLAAGVAHEINNPLSYVVANLDFASATVERLIDDHPGLADLRALHDALADAAHGAERVRRIVADLRVFARDDDGREERVDVNKAVQTAVDMVRHRVDHAARLELCLGAVPPVRAVEARLVQVLINLLVNAADAIGAGDASANKIVVATRFEVGSTVAIEVSDSGPGISAEVLPHIFDAFFTTKPVGVGTGLGLAICQGIVESLGGRIEVSSAVGTGTLARVTFPAAAGAPLPRPRVETPPRSASRRARLLIVDDEQPVLAALCRLLSRQHDVVVEDNVPAALAHLRAGEPFDVILCDVMMPSSSGAELMKGLLVARPELERRIVFMSGGTFTEEASAFVRNLTAPVLEKPIDADQLRRIIDEVARR